MRLCICMLLNFRFNPNMRIVPQIGIASYIKKFGHDITWILSSEDSTEFQEIAYNGIKVFVIPCKYKKGISHFLTKILYGIRRIQFVSSKFKNKENNLIFVRDDIFDGLIATHIQSKYKVPFVFAMSNPIEQEWESKKIFLDHRFFEFLIMKLKKYLYMHIMHNADLVLSISDWMKNDFVNKGISSSKIFSLPSGIEISNFIIGDGSDIRLRYGLGNSNVIVYVGTMERERCLEILIRAFSKVKIQKENVKLLMIGDSDQTENKNNLVKLANDLKISADVIFTGRILFSEIPNFIASADIGVSPIPPFSFYKLSSPIKMFEYMAMSKPVVVNWEIPEHEKVIKMSGGGVLVNYDEESFASGIIELLDHPDNAKKMGENGHEWVIKNRDYKILALKLEERYQQLYNQQL